MSHTTVMNELNDRIKEFIIAEVNPELQLTHIEDDEPLIESGIIDSLGILKIMSFLDEAYGVDLSAGEIKLENFRDIRTICRLVQEQQS